jgi:hypothetical protein
VRKQNMPRFSRSVRMLAEVAALITSATRFPTID